MKRDDLPAGNHGWQVLDPTPQEQSDGTVRAQEDKAPPPHERCLIVSGPSRGVLLRAVSSGGRQGGEPVREVRRSVCVRRGQR